MISLLLGRAIYDLSKLWKRAWALKLAKVIIQFCYCNSGEDDDFPTTTTSIIDRKLKRSCWGSNCHRRDHLEPLHIRVELEAIKKSSDCRQKILKVVF